MKNKSIYVIIFIAFLGCTKSVDSQENKLPDLVITNITYTFETPYSNPPTPQQAYVVFSITIKNIGNKDLATPFYIAFTYHKEEFENEYYSLYGLVNDPPLKIGVGQSIEVKISYIASIIKEYGSEVKFNIHTDGKRNTKDYLPRIEESNYDNNTFRLKLKL